MPLNWLRSASVVAVMTLLSRITGLVRDVVFAHLLGDKAAADVFFVAFRIPNFFRRIFGEGAFSAAFVPVFTEIHARHQRDETERFLQLLSGRFGLILLLVSVLGVVAAPALVALVAPGFLADADKFQLATDATRITFPYLFFISLVALAAGMLNTCGRFALPAATPMLLNLSLIAAAWLLAPRMSAAPIALSCGVVLAGVLQWLVQIPLLRRERLLVAPRLRTRAEDAADAAASAAVGRVFRLTLPALFGVSVAQINVLVGTLLASFLATGSISWLYYSDRLMEFPVGVFGIALSTALLPALSRRRGQAQAFARTLDVAARWAVVISVPASVGLGVLAAPLIATIFFHGDFSAIGVRMAAASLLAYALGLTAIVLVKILAPGFYAQQDTRTPVRIAVVAVGANIVLSLVLVWPLAHVGLALATSLAAVLNAAGLYLALRRRGLYRAPAGWGALLARVGVAALGMGALLVWLAGDTEAWLTMSAGTRAARLAGIVAAGGVVYFAALLVLGWRPRFADVANHDSGGDS